jgi:uncharacterized cupin superfamily protein
MLPTTLLKHKSEMQREPLPNCHEGAGVLDWTNVLDSKALAGRHLNFIHDDILAPGVSVGVHRHERDEEYYYIVSGEGMLTLDDEQFPVKAGDISAVYPGGRHGLANTGAQDLRIIVISVS